MKFNSLNFRCGFFRIKIVISILILIIGAIVGFYSAKTEYDERSSEPTIKIRGIRLSDIPDYPIDPNDLPVHETVIGGYDNSDFIRDVIKNGIFPASCIIVFVWVGCWLVWVVHRIIRPVIKWIITGFTKP